jgi:hypothetical protein
MSVLSFKLSFIFGQTLEDFRLFTYFIIPIQTPDFLCDLRIVILCGNEDTDI